MLGYRSCETPYSSVMNVQSHVCPRNWRLRILRVPCNLRSVAGRKLYRGRLLSINEIIKGKGRDYRISKNNICKPCKTVCRLRRSGGYYLIITKILFRPTRNIVKKTLSSYFHQSKSLHTSNQSLMVSIHHASSSLTIMLSLELAATEGGLCSTAASASST